MHQTDAPINHRGTGTHAVLRNHSNLRTMSQRSNAYHQLHQKPDEALQTYNTRYASFFNLAYPELELDNHLSRMHCIHYDSSLYSKLRDEMTGRFNQDLPENLQTAFEKAMNFEPRIITKQSINNRKIHEVNHIDITHGEDEVEINEAHVRNPNYKGKNYDLNYQQNRSKATNTANNASSQHTNKNQSYRSSSHHNKATQDMDITNLTNRRKQLMYLSHYTDQSTKSNYTRSRRYYNIRHSTGTGSNQKTAQ